jgi:hypothetical protein
MEMILVDVDLILSSGSFFYSAAVVETMEVYLMDVDAAAKATAKLRKMTWPKTMSFFIL